MKSLFGRIARAFSTDQADPADQPGAADDVPGTGHDAGAADASGPQASPSPASLRGADVDEIAGELCAYVAGKGRRRLQPEQVNRDASAWDSGYLDSLSYVEFLAHIDSRYGVNIPDVLLTGRLKSIRSIADYICEVRR